MAVFHSEGDAKQAAVVSWFGTYLKREPRVDEMVYWVNFITNAGYASAMLWCLRDNGVFKSGNTRLDEMPSPDAELSAEQAQLQQTQVRELEG